MQIFVEGVCLRVCFTIFFGYIMKTFHNKMFKNVKKVCIAYATKKKSAEDLNTQFSRKEIQMANEYMKRCSASLFNREMRIETAMMYRLTPVRFLRSKR